MKIDNLKKQKIQPKMLPVTTLNSLLLSSFIKEQIAICFQAVISFFLVFKKFSCRLSIGIVENWLQ